MFRGSIVALVTPMDEHNAVDATAWLNLLDYHLEAGTDAIVVNGTTGESPTVSETEFQDLLEAAVRHVDGRIPVIAGTGSPDTAKAIERTRQAAELGAEGALVVTPYYNRPMQNGLEAHFRAVADASPIPLILYNVPSRTAVDMQPQTVAKLAGHPGIVGLKEAVGRRERVQELHRLCGDGFKLFSGDDATCVMALEEGAVGVISVAANVAPAHMKALVDAALGGDRARASGLQSELEELFTQLSVQTNPIPVKWAAFKMGLIGPGIRLPLQSLDPQRQGDLENCLLKLGLLPAG